MDLHCYYYNSFFFTAFFKLGNSLRICMMLCLYRPIFQLLLTYIPICLHYLLLRNPLFLTLTLIL